MYQISLKSVHGKLDSVCIYFCTKKSKNINKFQGLHVFFGRQHTTVVIHDLSRLNNLCNYNIITTDI